MNDKQRNSRITDKLCTTIVYDCMSVLYWWCSMQEDGDAEPDKN